MLAELGVEQKDPTYVFTDSQGSYNTIKNPINSRLRHVNTRYHRVRQAASSREVKMHMLGTKFMLADLMTKNLPEPVHRYLRDLCMDMARSLTFPPISQHCLPATPARAFPRPLC